MVLVFQPAILTLLVGWDGGAVDGHDCKARFASVRGAGWVFWDGFFGGSLGSLSQ